MNRLLSRILNFYVTGFKEMTWGRTLWIIIVIKLFIIFIILRLLFFPSFLGDKSQEEKMEYVGSELINRAE